MWENEAEGLSIPIIAYSDALASPLQCWSCLDFSSRNFSPRWALDMSSKAVLEEFLAPEEDMQLGLGQGY